MTRNKSDGNSSAPDVPSKTFKANISFANGFLLNLKADMLNDEDLISTNKITSS
jgi:hypothetical protein